ncbi:hypothetical protein OKW96_14545 [Sphingobacterium sp. KU25419]|nr:hypothetical protein OKW96_14545 [Sphingobacterium sp. KU25419]
MAALPLTGAALKVSSLRELSQNFEATEKFPVLFLGHGSPMNAIEEMSLSMVFETSVRH